MTGDFHFDAEIIHKLQQNGVRMREVRITACSGRGTGHVHGMRCAGNMMGALRRYRRTTSSAAAKRCLVDPQLLFNAEKAGRQEC